MRTLRYAILGLVDRKPTTGYDIAKEFKERELSNFWSARHSQIYPELRKLTEEGLLEYEVEIMGAEHVGYGFDLCDSYDEARAALRGEKCERNGDCLLNHGQIPLVTAALLQRGMDEESQKKIIGGNFLGYFKEMI